MEEELFNQIKDLHKLRKLSKFPNLNLNSNESNLPIPSKFVLICLLKNIFGTPEKGLIEKSVWLKLGKHFHEAPGASTELLALLRMVMACLINQGAMTGGVDIPTQFQSDSKLPKAAGLITFSEACNLQKHFAFCFSLPDESPPPPSPPPPLLPTDKPALGTVLSALQNAHDNGG